MTPVLQIPFDSRSLGNFLYKHHKENSYSISRIMRSLHSEHEMRSFGDRVETYDPIISNTLNLRKGDCDATPTMVKAIHDLAMALFNLKQESCGEKLLEHARDLTLGTSSEEGIKVRRVLIRRYTSSLEPIRTIPLLVEITEIQDVRMREMSRQISDLTNRLGKHIETTEPTRKRKKR